MICPQVIIHGGTVVERTPEEYRTSGVFLCPFESLGSR